MDGQTEKYLFWIALLTLLLVYYAGAVKLAPVLTNGLVKLINAGSGRNAQGNFSPYAGNAPKV